MNAITTATITTYAFWQWQNGQADGPADLAETLEELPGKYRAPYAVPGH